MQPASDATATARELGIGGGLALAVAIGISALLRSVQAEGGAVGALLGIVFVLGCVGVAIGWAALIGRVRGAAVAAIASCALPVCVGIGVVAHAPALIALAFAAFAIAHCRTPNAGVTAPPAVGFVFCVGDAAFAVGGHVSLTAAGTAALAHALIATFVWLALSIAWAIARIREPAPRSIPPLMRYRA